MIILSRFKASRHKSSALCLSSWFVALLAAAAAFAICDSVSFFDLVINHAVTPEANASTNDKIAGIAAKALKSEYANANIISWRT